MRVCILGSGLSSLTLAKSLVNQNIHVDVLYSKKTYSINKTRTIGISKSNVAFFNERIINIEKIIYKLNRIEIYSENLNYKKILNFQNNGKNLFSVLKNNELIDYLTKKLKKDKLCKFKENLIHKNILTQNYNLIINCDISNFITKRFFSKRLIKNYKH